jgi:hypothetical protein
MSSCWTSAYWHLALEFLNTVDVPGGFFRAVARELGSRAPMKKQKEALRKAGATELRIRANIDQPAGTSKVLYLT